MPRLSRWTAPEAERALLGAGFELRRSRGSHRISGKGTLRVTVPFHGGAALHPKIVKQVFNIMEEVGTVTGLEE